MNDGFKTEYTCGRCGEAFTSWKSRPRMYCSRACQVAARNTRSKKPLDVRACVTCGSQFSVKPSSAKKYCSLSCAAKNQTPKGCALVSQRTAESPFVHFVNLAKRNSKTRGKPEPDINAAKLAKLFKSQYGRCALSGAKLTLPYNSANWAQEHRGRAFFGSKASLDRIDPELGYVTGNIQFVSVFGNLTKWKFSNAETTEFCTAVRDHHDGLDTEHGLEFPQNWSAVRSSKRPFEVYADRLEPQVAEDVFNAQGGRCPFTGWRLWPPWWPFGTGWEVGDTRHLRYRASLDRVDTSIGYEPRNVRFVAPQANMGRSDQPDAEFVDFCRQVARWQQRRNLFIVTGPFAAGKSWVCEQLSRSGWRYVSFDRDNDHVAKLIDACDTGDKTVFDVGVTASTFIGRYTQFKYRVCVISESTSVLQQRLEGRGGTWTSKHALRSTRFKTMASLAEFSGTSSEVLRYLLAQ